jgi:hypothetical protein
MENFRMRFLLFCGLALVFPVVIFLSLTDAPVDRSIEWELAIVNANDQVASNHPAINEFRILLDRLEKKCSNSRQDIADICMTGYLYRKERGNLDTLLEFTQKVDEAVPDHFEGAVDLTQLVRAMLGE